MIELKNVRRSYGDYVAVDDVSFIAQPGRVTGFLGPNGAGKSTCMRMMVGLTPPSSGSVTVLGRNYHDLVNPGRHVGALLDASAQHGGRTGREILRLTCMSLGLPTARADELLEVVGLNVDESKRLVRNYSLGMRQRLGIANALIGDPRVLILDEPANGLDPAGIRWMRGLLRNYAAEGGTVLLSSHLLHEIEVVADDIIVIGNGKIVSQGTKAALMANSGTSVSTTDDAYFASVLRQAGIEVTAAPRGLTVSAEPLAIGQLAAQHQVVLTELKDAGSAGLEELFLQLTASNAREEVTA